MEDSSKAKESLKQKFIHEMILYIFYTLFLTIFLCAFSTYKRLILGEYAISYIHYGYSFVESLILAKVILIGQTLKLGERFSGRPLVVPTLYKTIIFSIFALFFKIFELFFIGLLEKKPLSQLYEELLNRGLYEISAEIFILFFVFTIFFAFLEIGRFMGGKTLFNLFFSKK